ncbi:predicted protein [Chaetomium globosum CBS 148.51]|uniref:Uncharacterized protein n=1 Tax=Chaetomium globosum (strain ATCC 6205 / CBS 148.51 / DSM 1962 / NBRC 6347 / NRRL 1970) TaxID=306901 RepID=Q2GSI0_CHAGB|nr:uncharacterized protein CHGG_09074 [Chaetomium globosum CBS 148.51]EAQ85060.1 predicted protein [Chaetomium globosum CBS 148.51]
MMGRMQPGPPRPLEKRAKEPGCLGNMKDRVDNQANGSDHSAGVGGAIDSGTELGVIRTWKGAAAGRRNGFESRPLLLAPSLLVRCPRSVLVPVMRERRPLAGNQDVAMLRARNLIKSTQASLEEARACCPRMHPHHAVSSLRPHRSCNKTGQMGLGGLMRLALGDLGVCPAAVIGFVACSARCHDGSRECQSGRLDP